MTDMILIRRPTPGEYLTEHPPGEWEHYLADDDEDKAAAAFFKKHGRPPMFVRDLVLGQETAMPTRRLILGPVDEAKDA